MSWLQLLVAPFTSIAENWQKRRQRKDEIADAQHARNLKYIEGGEVREHDLNLAAIQAQERTLKDEVAMATMFIPLWVLMYAVLFGDEEMLDRVKRMFDELASLPDWYVGLVIAIVVAVMGLRGWKFAKGVGK